MRSSQALKDLRDTIDDQRMGGTPLKDIAAKLKLQAVTVPPIDRQGNDQTGKPVTIPLQAQLIQALFSADQGSDPETIDGRDAGLLWFSLDNVVAARDRSLDEAKAEVAAAWAADQRVQRLKDKAGDLVKQMNEGKKFEDIAKGLNQPVFPAWNLVRNADKQQLPPATVGLIFATPLKGYGSAVAANGTDRIVFHVEDNVIPELDLKSPEAIATAKQISADIGQDLMTEYVGKVQADIGVSINQTNVDRIIGGSSAL